MTTSSGISARYKRILVATDFSKSAELALNCAKELASATGAELHVLHFMEDPMPGLKAADSVCPVPVIRKDMEEEARVGMSKVLTASEQAQFRAKMVTLWGKAHVQIVRYAKEHDIDLIVLGSHGMGFVEHMFIGSVAERVVRRAHCAVLVVRDPQVAEQVERAAAGVTVPGIPRP